MGYHEPFVKMSSNGDSLNHRIAEHDLMTRKRTWTRSRLGPGRERRRYQGSSLLAGGVWASARPELVDVLVATCAYKRFCMCSESSVRLRSAWFFDVQSVIPVSHFWEALGRLRARFSGVGTRRKL